MMATEPTACSLTRITLFRALSSLSGAEYGTAYDEKHGGNSAASRFDPLTAGNGSVH